MKRISIVLMLLLGAIGCSDLNVQTLDNPYLPLSLTTKQGEFNAAGHDFDFNLIQATNRQMQGDWLISPLSMQCLLGMLLNGAQGETAYRICAALGFGEGEKTAVNEYFQAMLVQLPSLDKTATLAMANALFAAQDFPVKTPFRNTLQKDYQAIVENIDYAAGWSRKINAWCKNNTNGMIDHIIDDDSNVFLLALNALYFKAPWSQAFSKSNTAKEIFTSESGKTRRLAMMKQAGDGQCFHYGEQASFETVRLPYGNGAFAMYVILPKNKQTICSVVKELDAASWNQALESMYQPQTIDLWLPRFEQNGDEGMIFNKILSEMGLPLLFGGGDFGALSEGLEGFSLIQQNTAISVSEEGTEAAAISQAAGIGIDASVNRNAVFHADHPFLYLITESSTGSILFAGCFTGEE